MKTQSNRSPRISKGEGKGRDACIEAANESNREGLLAMTLDRIAEEAGVSKGGLLYHFPSKDELIVALLTHFVNGCNLERVEKDSESKPPMGPRRSGYCFWARRAI